MEIKKRNGNAARSSVKKNIMAKSRPFTPHTANKDGSQANGRDSRRVVGFN